MYNDLSDHESCDRMLEEFSDASTDFTESANGSDISAEDRFVNMLNNEAINLKASAIFLHRLDGDAKYEMLINGKIQRTDQIHNEIFSGVCQCISALAEVTPDGPRLPRVTSWDDTGGKRWRVIQFADTHDNPITLMADLDRNASLSLTTIKDPVEVKEMLRHYRWLRPILDTISDFGNKVSSLDTSKENPKRASLLKQAENWLTLLEEIANHMTDPQAHMILRMVSSFRAALESDRNGEELDTIDVLNAMIEDSNQQIREEERKAFWT